MTKATVQFQLRLPPDLHKRLVKEANEKQVSLNAYIVALLEKKKEEVK